MFTTKERTGGSQYRTLCEGAPDGVRDAIQEAHGGELPNDWRYEKASMIWMALEEATENGWGPNKDEEIDSLVDIYNGELLQWLADIPSRVDLVDQASGEFFVGSRTTIINQIQGAQHQTLTEMWDILEAEYQNQKEQ